MYFDFSRGKTFTLTGLAVALSSLIALFIIVNNATAFVRLASEISAREVSYGSYFLQFKLPAMPASVFGFFSHATSTAPDGNAVGVPVLLYHGEGNGPASDMSTATFVGQLRALKDAGWRTVTLSEFEDYMAGKRSLPAKSFLLTFDDGRRDTFYAADPVLADLGDTAVMFVITGFSLPDNANEPLRNFYLSKSELAYMQKSGRWELESHGDQDHWLYDIAAATSTPGHVDTTSGGHFISNLFWLTGKGRMETSAEYTARISDDLTLSKKLLEKDFGTAVDVYAFPFNDFGEDTVNFPGAQSIVEHVASSIYRFGFVQVDPEKYDSFNYPDPNTFFIKRIEPSAYWSGADLLSVLESGAPRSLPYRASFFGPEWQSSWGNVAPRGQTLFLSATPQSTGAAVLLAGSEWWKDYDVTASVSVIRGEFSVLARAGSDATLACTLTPSQVLLEKKGPDGVSTLAAADYASAPGKHRFEFSLQGGHARCTVDGVSASASVNVTRAGNVGFQVWSSQKSAAQATVGAVSVDSL